MRSIALAAVLISAATAHAEPITRQECALHAAVEDQLALALRRTVGAIEQTADAERLYGKARGPLAEPSARALEARARYLSAAKAYLHATEDFGHQLRVCAR